MKRWQSLFIIAGLLWASALMAVPAFTPLIDGTKDDGWGDTPDEPTSSLAEPVAFHLNDGLWVTEDASNLYIGFWGPPDPFDDGRNCHIHICIDVGNTATGGFYSAWPAGGININYVMPYLPEFDLITQWGWGNTVEFTGLNEWVPLSSSWNQHPEITTDAGGGNSWTEIALDRTLLGEPEEDDTLNFTVWLRPSWGGAPFNTPGGSCCLPEQANFPSDSGLIANNLTVQFPYRMQLAPVDTVAPRLLSVQQVDRELVRLTFDEAMSQVSMTNTNNYTPYGGWVITSTRNATSSTIDLMTSVDFVDGNAYSVLVEPAVTDVFGNPVDPDYDSLGWTAPTYGVVTFKVHDPGVTQDALVVRGSWNDFHEHDFGWPGAELPLYDDGTHGDAVPGDNTHTLSTVFSPQPDTTYEWKVLSDEGAWLVPGDNLTFSLPNTDSVTTEYTLPDTITQAVTVTYSVNMNCVQSSFDSVTVAGSHDGWAGSLMTDAGGGIYTYDHLFPTGTVTDQEFKFRSHTGGGTDWEGVGNRIFTIDDSSPTQVLPTYYFNDDTCSFTTADVTVTFVVDMQCVSLGANIDSVMLVGTMNDWGGTQIRMTDNLDGTFSVDHLFATGSVIEQEYKFQYWDAGVDYWEDAIGNRYLEVDDSGPTQVLPNVFFNDWVCPPAEVTIVVVGDSIRLDWLGPDRASFDVFIHTEPDSILENGVLDTTTTLKTRTKTHANGGVFDSFFLIRAKSP